MKGKAPSHFGLHFSSPSSTQLSSGVNETRPDLDPITATPLGSLRGVGEARIMTVCCLKFWGYYSVEAASNFFHSALKLKHSSKSQKKNDLVTFRIDSPGFELFSECPVEG